jgi:flotillin
LFTLFENPLLVGIAGLVLVIVIVAVIVIRRYRIANPDEAIIVTGRKGKNTQDLTGQKVVTGGGVFVLPFVQKAFQLSLRSRQLSITTTAQTQNGITISARAVAVVKVGGSEEMIRAAAQRFLSQQEEIESSTQEVLSGSLRGIIGGMTVESIIRDRTALASAVLGAAEEALTKQGLVVDTLQIQEINDTQNYITNIGRPEAAKVSREADIADVEAQRAAEEAKIDAQKIILEKNRDLRLREAAIQQETDQARSAADAAKPLEDAIQRQKIVEAEEVTAQKEASLREQQLNAEVRKVADAEAYRIKTTASANAEAYASKAEGDARAAVSAATAEKERRELAASAMEREGLAQKVNRTALADAVKAEGQAEAESIAARGRAEADAISARAEALAQQSQAVLAQDALKALPLIARELAAGYGSIDTITVVSADGANKITGDIVGNVKGVTEMLKDATGIDVAGLINGAVTGTATGNAIGAQLGKAQGSKQAIHNPTFTPVTKTVSKSGESAPKSSLPTSTKKEAKRVETLPVIETYETPHINIDETQIENVIANQIDQTQKYAEKAEAILSEAQKDLINFASKQFDKVEKGLKVAKQQGIPVDRIVDNKARKRLVEVINRLENENLLNNENFIKTYPLTADLFNIN